MFYNSLNQSFQEAPWTNTVLILGSYSDFPRFALGNLIQTLTIRKGVSHLGPMLTSPNVAIGCISPLLGSPGFGTPSPVCDVWRRWHFSTQSATKTLHFAKLQRGGSSWTGLSQEYLAPDAPRTRWTQEEHSSLHPCHNSQWDGNTILLLRNWVSDKLGSFVLTVFIIPPLQSF